jgi:hypothetical protein
LATVTCDGNKRTILAHSLPSSSPMSLADSPAMCVHVVCTGEGVLWAATVLCALSLVVEGAAAAFLVFRRLQGYLLIVVIVGAVHVVATAVSAIMYRIVTKSFTRDQLEEVRVIC